MSGNTKYHSGCSWEDICQYTYALGREHGLGAVITIQGGHAVGSKLLQVEVALYELGRSLDGPRDYVSVQRGGMLKRGDAQSSHIMLVLQQAFHHYQNDPWNWTLVDRRRETQSEG